MNIINIKKTKTKKKKSKFKFWNFPYSSVIHGILLKIIFIYFW